jgi:hypothetical protein
MPSAMKWAVDTREIPAEDTMVCKMVHIHDDDWEISHVCMKVERCLTKGVEIPSTDAATLSKINHLFWNQCELIPKCNLCIVSKYAWNW